MAKHSIRRGIIDLSYHEKMSEIAVTIPEKTLAVSIHGLNGTLQKEGIPTLKIVQRSLRLICCRLALITIQKGFKNSSYVSHESTMIYS